MTSQSIDVNQPKEFRKSSVVQSQDIPSANPINENLQQFPNTILDDLIERDNYGPLEKVLFVKPKIWIDKNSQNIYRFDKKRNDTSYFYCKHKKCKGTCKVSRGIIKNMRAHTIHQESNADLLTKELLKNALRFTAIYKKTLSNSEIYLEMLKIFPMFNDSTNAKKKTNLFNENMEKERQGHRSYRNRV